MGSGLGILHGTVLLLYPRSSFLAIARVHDRLLFINTHLCKYKSPLQLLPIDEALAVVNEFQKGITRVLEK